MMFIANQLFQIGIFLQYILINILHRDQNIYRLIHIDIENNGRNKDHDISNEIWKVIMVSNIDLFNSMNCLSQLCWNERELMIKTNMQFFSKLNIYSVY